MRINTNVNAMIATNQMTKNTALSGASMEKLSTGLRITKAGDDATGLAISEKMRSQIRGMEQAERNVQDGISMVQTAEGAMEEIGNITQRMRELAVQASNETNSADDRDKITAELKQLNSEITRISDSTTFNNEKILTGGKELTENALAGKLTATNLEISENTNFTGVAKIKFDVTDGGGGKKDVTLSLVDENDEVVRSQKLTGYEDDAFNAGAEINFSDLGIKFKLTEASLDAKNGTEVELEDGGPKQVSVQAGANNETSNKIVINIEAMDSKSLGIENDAIDKIADSNIGIGTKAANDFINTLDEALKTINTSRATLGAQQNRLEYTSANLTSSTENLSAAESRIRDVDVAKEMVKLSKLNILNQASQAMVSQAKQQPESVSQLLR